jgi:hypothetical protein
VKDIPQIHPTRWANFVRAQIARRFLFTFGEERRGSFSQSKRVPSRFLHSRKVRKTFCMLKTGDLGRDSLKIFSHLEEKMQKI